MSHGVRNVLVMGGLTGRIGRGVVCKLAERVRLYAHGRDAARVRAANRHGIHVYVGDHLVQLGGRGGRPVTFVSDASEFPPAEETLVVSATTADNVLSTLTGLPAGSNILTLENGWDTPAMVKAHNPGWNVSGGVAWFSCKADPARPGYDRVTPGGYIAVEPFSSIAAEQHRQLWGDDEMIRLVNQVAPEKRKTITNSMFNGLGIIFDLKIGQVLQLRGYKALMRALAHEGRLAAELAGSGAGSEDELFAMAYAIASKNASDHTSAYAMMAKGMPTEIPTMNGAIAREGSKHGVTFRINAYIDASIAQMTAWRAAAPSLGAVHQEHSDEIASWRADLLGMGAGYSDGYPA
jgi:ketopantoate reductase